MLEIITKLILKDGEDLIFFQKPLWEIALKDKFGGRLRAQVSHERPTSIPWL